MQNVRTELTRGRGPHTVGILTTLVGLTFALSVPAPAQQTTHEHHHGAAHPAGVHPASTVEGSAIQISPHLRVTPLRAATSADSARASAIVASLRHSIGRYRDARAAVADGYVRFAPERRQRVVHLTNSRHAARNDSSFDAARPTSLLYRRGPGSSLVLVGAMYTAPRDASIEMLDARVPLGVAQWHLHTNACVPKRGQSERWSETRDSIPVFGPQGGISTKEACDAVGGQFRETEFNWMVHVDFAADGTATWGH
jgi:hypothetical protein